MLNIFSNKSTPFFDLLDQQAGHALSCARRLQHLTLAFPAHLDEVKHIHEEELLADELTHQLRERLRGTFMPPIPPEEIYALTDSIDNITDAIDEASKRFDLYQIGSMESAFERQTDVLVQTTTHVAAAVHLIRQSRWLSDLRPTLDHIHRLESVGDDIHHAALSKLFDGTCEPLLVLKWKELYAAVEEAIDACESVGHTLERIALSNEG